MKGYVFAIIATLFWSPIGVFTKLIGDSIHPVSLVFYRLFFAFIVILLIIPKMDKTTFKANLDDIKEYAFVGFFLAGSLFFSTLAFYYGSVSNAIVLLYTYPIVVMIFGIILLKEKITSQKFIVFLIAFVGIMIMNPFQIEGSTNGNIFAILASIFAGIMTVLYRKEDLKHGIGDVFWFFFFALLFAIPIPFFFGLGNYSEVLIFLIPLGIFTAGFHILINLSMEKIDSYMASIIDLILTPLIAILLAVFIINETITLKLIISGSLIIFAGIYLIKYQNNVEKNLTKY